MIKWLIEWLYWKTRSERVESPSVFVYFISYFKPSEGFFNITIDLKSKVLSHPDIKSIELALMNCEIPEKEEERIVIINISPLGRKEGGAA